MAGESCDARAEIIKLDISAGNDPVNTRSLHLCLNPVQETHNLIFSGFRFSCCKEQSGNKQDENCQREEYYKDNQEQYQFSSQYRVRRIFLTASGNEDEKKAVHDQLTAFRKQIMEGSDFAELARQHSQGPEASEGGMMGWVKPGDLVEPLGSALTRLKAGDVSDVLETEFGLHLLRVEEYKSEGIMSFEEARTEIEPILRRQQGEKRYRQWMSTLRKRNNVKVLL